MKRKWLIILFITVIVLTGYVILFPHNVIDLNINSLEKSNIMYQLFYYITFLGSRTILIPFVILGSIYFYVAFKKIKPSLIFICGTLMGYFFNTLIKQIVMRERPSILETVHGVGYSFPSGHAMISTVCYGLFVFYLLKIIKTNHAKRLIVIITSGLLLLIGYSRIALGVHYFTDVLAGYLFGLIVLSIYLKLFKQVSN